MTKEKEETPPLSYREKETKKVTDFLKYFTQPNKWDLPMLLLVVGTVNLDTKKAMIMTIGYGCGRLLGIGAAIFRLHRINQLSDYEWDNIYGEGRSLSKSLFPDYVAGLIAGYFIGSIAAGIALTHLGIAPNLTMNSKPMPQKITVPSSDIAYHLDQNGRVIGG